MPLHQGQIKYLQETLKRKTRINVLVPGNRWGKTTLIACLQIWYLFYKFGIPPGNRDTWLKAEYRTANIAPHSALTEPVFKAIHQILTSSFAIRTMDGRITTNRCQIEWFYLKNKTLNTPPYKQYFIYNSYIEHRSLGGDGGDALQGKPFGIITYDEGGRSLHLEEEISGNILPRLGDWIGPFHLLSTPDQNSPSILYHYKLYQDGMKDLNSTYTQEGSLEENQLFGKEQIEEQYRMFENDPLKDQILHGKFMFGGDNLFEIAGILDAEDSSLNDGIRHEENHTYIIGTDSAMGADEIVHTVIRLARQDCPEHDWCRQGISPVVKQVAVKGNSKSPQRHINDFADLYDSYSGKTRPYHLLETWNGESARFYQDLPPYIQSKTKCYGSWQPEIRTTENKNRQRPKNQSVKKADILIALQKLISGRLIKIPKIDHNFHEKGATLSQQLSIYKEDDKNLPTDRAISLALAAWMVEDLTKKSKKVEWSDW